MERDLLERVLGESPATGSSFEWRVGSVPHDLPLKLPQLPLQQVVGSLTRRGTGHGPSHWQVHLNTAISPADTLEAVERQVLAQDWTLDDATANRLRLSRPDPTLRFTAQVEVVQGLTRLAMTVTPAPSLTGNDTAPAQVLARLAPELARLGADPQATGTHAWSDERAFGQLSVARGAGQALLTLSVVTPDD